MKYIGFSFCSRQAPRPFVLASVYRIVSFWGLQYDNIGALTISFLSIVNDSWCSGPQLKGTFSFVSSLMGSASSVNLGENLINNLSY